MKFKTPLLLFFYFLTYFFNFGQGCSDAGFCTMGAMKPDQVAPKQHKNHISSSLSHYVGYTKFDDYITSYTLELNTTIKVKNSLQIKLPYFLVFGKLANTKGVGDLSISASRGLILKESHQLSVSIGMKIPTNNSNFENNEGRPLPMYYQSSLGTYDLIMGLSLNTGKWLLATGVQHAFNENKNEFLWGKWTSNKALTEIASNYPRSKGLKRGTDIMLRVERNIRFSRLNAYIGLLPIMRLNNDTFINPKGERISDDGSAGLVLNLLTGFGYRFSTHSALKTVIGIKVFTRNSNPDGLSREAVNSITYEYLF